jgi:hypothetical protein
VRTMTESEAKRLLDGEEAVEKFKLSVKETSLSTVDSMTARGRAESVHGVKVNRLRLLEQRRLGTQHVLDVGVDGYRVGVKV